MDKLEALSSVLEIVQHAFPEVAKLAVFDREKVIADLPGEHITIESKIGSPLSAFEGTVSYKAVMEQKHFREERGPEKFGVAYISTAVPIFENEEFLGVLTAMISNQTIDTMKNVAAKISTAIENADSTSNELSLASNDLASQIQEIFLKSEEIIQFVRNSQQVLMNVERISEDSKLLSLNASIEAARIGDLGRGFSVVAKEMKKMAEYSKRLSNEIRDQMEEIQQAIINVHSAISQSAAFTQEHSAGMSELNAMFQQISSSVAELVESSRI